MKLGVRVLVVYAALLLQVAVSSRAQEYTQTNGSYTTSLTSSCFGGNYGMWGTDRSLAVGVSPALFKVAKNGRSDSCGQKMEVLCLSPQSRCRTGNPILNVTVVDQCINCDDNMLRLSLTAYNKLAKADLDFVILGFR
ncbi:hypothetical protein AXG93_3102s1400 [Marchantia polymorpha subsp. ruderalis]|uniref:Expansin-like EG45 domain-containing protein n=1 Tax=Marchantia polymorpha subsp. ruderalis TaxID=1480154 RepID=A0A176W9F8_MARPO|nr:hypothetical protein AXG93_3102s1400 [Marchantia polymorpha subsp. ruderalis]